MIFFFPLAVREMLERVNKSFYNFETTTITIKSPFIFLNSCTLKLKRHIHQTITEKKYKNHRPREQLNNIDILIIVGGAVVFFCTPQSKCGA